MARCRVRDEQTRKSTAVRRANMKRQIYEELLSYLVIIGAMVAALLTLG
jgi:hypothetical protein